MKSTPKFELFWYGVLFALLESVAELLMDVEKSLKSDKYYSHKGCKDSSRTNHDAHS